MSAEDLEKYESEMELQLYREYRDVVGLFSHVVETERRFYLCNSVDVKVRSDGGEVYFEAENPKGVLGFFIHSKGGGVPYRLKIRSPSFSSLSVLPKVAVGAMVADLAAILGSLDFVMGECDR